LFELIDQLCLVNIQELIKINEDYDIKINVYLKMNFYNFKIKKLKLTISIPTFFFKFQYNNQTLFYIGKYLDFNLVLV
jgi:hypothetical protein